MTRRLLLTALLSTAATSPAFGQTVAAPPDFAKVYGPSWTAFSRPGPGTRPGKLEKDVTVGAFGRSGNGMGVEVTFWADVADLKQGNRYELRYQLRVHTKKGEMGPLLGDAGHPNGVAYPLAAATAGDDWLGLEGAVDVTRKDLTAATGLPKPEKGKAQHTVFVRVEPQLYDATAGKYVTPGKTTALVLAAEVGANGKVWELQPLGEWVAMHRGNTADAALARLADLDEYDGLASGVDRGIERVLETDDVTAETKGKFIAALPAERVSWKPNFNLKMRLEKFAAGDDPVLKAAAEKKLDEAKK